MIFKRAWVFGHKLRISILQEDEMAIYIIIGVVVLILFYGIGVYNRLVRLRNKSEESVAAIDAHLKNRYEIGRAHV